MDKSRIRRSGEKPVCIFVKYDIAQGNLCNVASGCDYSAPNSLSYAYGAALKTNIDINAKKRQNLFIIGC